MFYNNNFYLKNNYRDNLFIKKRSLLINYLNFSLTYQNVLINFIKLVTK